jgi:8-amino-7-oxononanoate synthase
MPLGPELRFVGRTQVLFRGRPHLFFGGTDYHRLSRHPEVLRAAREAAESEGLSCAGSRITTGNHPALGQLERALAAFLGAREVVLCASGYLSNAVALEVLGGSFQRFFLDGSAHPSMSAPARALPAGRVHAFRAMDPEDLAKQVASRLRPRERPLVLTCGVAPADGELAPLGAYWEAVRGRGGALLVDDAHGIGTVGLRGEGSPGEARLPSAAFVQTGTLAKALGSFGGLVAGRAGLRARAVEQSPAFVGATPIPPPLAVAALRAIEILRADPRLVAGLRARTLHVRERLRALGLPAAVSPAPIVSVAHRSRARHARLRALLLEAGIYPSAISAYPGSPEGGHFRFVLASAHTDAEVNRLLEAIERSCA